MRLKILGPILFYIDLLERSNFRYYDPLPTLHTVTRRGNVDRSSSRPLFPLFDQLLIYLLRLLKYELCIYTTVGN